MHGLIICDACCAHGGMLGLVICDACCAHGGTKACLVWPYVMHVLPMGILERA